MRFEGIYRPVVTPYGDGFTIDRTAFAEVIEHLIGAGVHGGVVAGTTGEYYARSTDERVGLMWPAKDVIGDRVPLNGGTGGVLVSQGGGAPDIAVYVFDGGSVLGDVTVSGSIPLAILFQGSGTVAGGINVSGRLPSESGNIKPNEQIGGQNSSQRASRSSGFAFLQSFSSSREKMQRGDNHFSRSSLGKEVAASRNSTSASVHCPSRCST